MQLDHRNNGRLLADRVRLQVAVGFAPHIERMWFAKGGANLPIGLSVNLSPKRAGVLHAVRGWDGEPLADVDWGPARVFAGSSEGASRRQPSARTGHCWQRQLWTGSGFGPRFRGTSKGARSLFLATGILNGGCSGSRECGSCSVRPADFSLRPAQKGQAKSSTCAPASRSAQP